MFLSHPIYGGLVGMVKLRQVKLVNSVCLWSRVLALALSILFDYILHNIEWYLKYLKMLYLNVVTKLKI